MNLSNLTNSNLILLNNDAKTKDEVIKTLVNKLYKNGKLSSEEGFLKAVFDREKLSATGLEGGLAIPHGKSNFVKEASFAVMSTTNIVGWESLDPDNEVKYIFLLAIPEAAAGDTHLELLSELMTRMSDDEYKEKLFASKDVKQFMTNLDNELVDNTGDIVYTKSIVAVTACPAGIAHTYMAAEALVKAGNNMGIKVYVEKQGANGTEDRHTSENLKNADAAIFAVAVGVKEEDRFKHLAITKVGVAEPLKDAEGIIKKALEKAENHKKGEYVETESSEEKESIGSLIKQSVMTGISYMVPLIIAAGMINAMAVMAANLFDLQHLYDHATGAGSWLNNFRVLGSTLFGTFLIPVLAAYMSYSLADKTGLVSGFAAGIIANMIGGGFLAGMAGGLFAGFTVRALKKYLPAKGAFAGFVSFWCYPVFSTVIVGIGMFFIIGPPVAWINQALLNFLESLGGANAALLGAVLGIMASFDLGGPVNKAAYTFCAGAMAEGILMPYCAFASIKMVSGFAVTLITIIDKQNYTQDQQDVGKTTWILALAGITEGAIPFMMADPLRVIFSLCTGSAVTGILVALFDIGLNVPGAGIFSLFMLTPSPGSSYFVAAAVWLGSAIIGAIISTALLYVTKRKFQKNN
ncbi:PTS 2-O-a-mannosyl-D-glycerate transporter subunit IIABC [Candidatus Epulonipiscium fishelsonii]|uniref:PTS 2-O-a-mannosyl-D-glycerate transporter subunit IIABC n=1 Tax=Candidatus Epulonipiscium fishelsonii TaxID=77094 RepID=A0ACC8X9M4_9FIRM|nr:PTS 2-O-a-mannosyl-D-glycerate transporter subunit IIABC [Epulopiscium sp. SCG-B11WGA-EpuloA1]ONI39018.1 PTS 2-O-a-mannosyl-D-glycerate transporter subunit IIABC [Epulopiscium sp. SCG-B05WGA-EpuloA1]